MIEDEELIGSDLHPNGYIALFYEDLGGYRTVDNQDVKYYSDNLIINNIYPNPFDKTFTISFLAPQKGILKFSIVDILGQTIKVIDISAEAGLNNIPIELEGIGKGVYQVTLSDSNGHSAIYKIVSQ